MCVGDLVPDKLLPQLPHSKRLHVIMQTVVLAGKDGRLTFESKSIDIGRVVRKVCQWIQLFAALFMGMMDTAIALGKKQRNSSTTIHLQK